MKIAKEEERQLRRKEMERWQRGRERKKEEKKVKTVREMEDGDQVDVRRERKGNHRK